MISYLQLAQKMYEMVGGQTFFSDWIENSFQNELGYFKNAAESRAGDYGKAGTGLGTQFANAVKSYKGAKSDKRIKAD